MPWQNRFTHTNPYSKKRIIRTRKDSFETFCGAIQMENGINFAKSKAHNMKMVASVCTFISNSCHLGLWLAQYHTGKPQNLTVIHCIAKATHSHTQTHSVICNILTHKTDDETGYCSFIMIIFVSFYLLFGITVLPV